MSTLAEPATGVWTNHENGLWTLTLNARSAGMLSAALVLFVAPVSIQAWSITKFLLHQFYAGDTESDGFHQTRQTMLRNSVSPEQISWLSIRIAWTWRKTKGPRRAVSRMIPVFSVAIVSMICWILVGLFTSSIWSESGNQLLVSPEVCGHVDLNASTVDFARSWTMYWADRFQSASTYERQCQDTLERTGICARLPGARIPWNLSDTSCLYPPEEDLCIRTNSTPVKLDTGFVNSNRHLGMNSAPVDSIDYRRIAECSPMQANYMTVSPGTGRVWDSYSFYYGMNTITMSNRTVNYNSASQALTDEYTLYALSHDPFSEPPSNWKPNATIFDRADAEISIVFLAGNGVKNYNRVYDPWFSAGPESQTDSAGNQLYNATRLVTILGCIEQHQICTPSEVGNQRCTTLSSFSMTNKQVEFLQLTPRQRATATRILLNVAGIDMAFIATWLQGDALLASRTLLNGRQNVNLPNTQWRNEVSRWFDIALLLLQDGVVQYVTGPSRPEWKQFVARNDDPDEVAECATQRVYMDSTQQNFSVAGIIVMVVLGSCIIALGLSIDTIAAWAQKRLRKGGRRREAWLLDGTFQHQRLAYRGLGVMSWENVGEEIPVSKEEKFPSRMATQEYVGAR